MARSKLSRTAGRASAGGLLRATFCSVDRCLHRVVCLGLCLSALASTGRAADATPIRVEFDEGAACSAPDDFFAALQRRSDRVRQAAPGEAAFNVRVRLERRGGKVVGELRVIHEQGETSPRAVVSASCEAVVDALSLTAAMAVDAVVAEGAQAAPPEPPAAKQVDAPSRAGDARGARVGDHQEDDVDQADVETALDVELGGHVGVTRVVSPFVNVGGGLTVRLAPRSGFWRSSWGLVLDYSQSGLLGSAQTATFRLLTAELALCPLRLALARRLDFEPCLLANVGQLTAEGKNLSESASVTRSWWSAGGFWRASVYLDDESALELELGARLPLVERRFVTLPDRRSVAETPRLAPFAQVGFVHRF